MSISVYEVINTKIIELLEQGTIPWRKTWNGESNYPQNLISKKEYQGINHFLLSAMPFNSPYWLTYKQVQDKGGHVIKGSKSTPVIFWKWLDRKNRDESEDEGNRAGKIPLLRYFSVFNLDQTQGIPAPETEETHNEHERLQEPEQIIRNMPMRPEIKFGGNKAVYSPHFDFINMPHLSSFEGPEEYYSTLFHELVHSTGHASRLGRKSVLEPSYFGSHEYSKEELVAEMGAAFLCGLIGIDHKTIENSAAYIRGWLKVLRSDKTLLVQSAALAQKASDYIANRKGGEEEVAQDIAA